ncbi:DUF6457 domain-containing protein [Micromonospora eburnea]|uniref:DUF6457 domain-containing protein n=1 Tax=Micromonospora eburnea TaxID=227316 RepID=A0A1C6UX53_9ACTN|nr:DUF6457 domain-containing protein [Micromonospora eburnea]SCL58591.1 hypothetical protein GA0070604_3867 [Micromonospora eburnea]
MTDPRLNDWLATAAAALDLPTPAPDEYRAILDLVRDVAHGVCRPAAPLGAYLVGVAVGRGADPDAARAAVAALVAQETR